MESNTSTAISPRLLLFVLLILTAGFRVVQLDADPPADFSWSGGYFADEGFWSHNARNSVLFGGPIRDEWDARIVSPLFAFFQRIVFHFLGVGLRQVRIIGIFSALLIALVSFSIFRKEFNPGVAFLLSAAIVLSFPMLVLARQGILDPFAAALAWCCFSLILLQSPAALFFAGVLLVASCITKYLMVYAFVPIAFTLYNAERRNLIVFVSGIVTAFAAWFLADYLPHHDLLTAYSRYYSSQQSWQPAAVLKNIITQPFFLYFLKTPAILFFGNAGMWFFLSTAGKSTRVEKICWIWLASGILFFALWRYRPVRYYTSLLLPLSALAGFAVLRFREIAVAIKSRRLLWIGIVIPLLQTIFFLCDRFFEWRLIPAQLGIDVMDACLFLALNVFALLSAAYGKEKAGWAIALFFAIFLLSDVRHYLEWMVNPQYQALEISRDLQDKVGNGVLAGQWAPELCLENKVRTVPVWYGFVNSRDPFKKFGITHVLVWRYALGGEKFEDWYADDFKVFQPIYRYRIKNSDLILYQMRR